VDVEKAGVGGHSTQGIEKMSASWASHLYAREICGCVEKAGVGGHSTQVIEKMSASWASHLYPREICGCVEKAGVGEHSMQGIFTCTKFLGINCGPTHD
jgi:hypothetical protein